VREQVDGASELFGWESQRSLERSASVFRVNRWKARRRLRAPYRRVAENLYRAVTVAAGTSLIVDTSHYPLRAREIQAVNGIDLFLLYLIRDPQSVVASFNRQDVAQYSKSTFTTNVYLWLTNLLSVLVFLKHPRDRRMVVRYESLVADPELVVSDILSRVGVPPSTPDLSALDTGVAFQGNRLIRSERIAFDRRPAVPSRASLITTLLQLPWTLVLRRLGPVAGRTARG
jgi:hypothetical protein